MKSSSSSYDKKMDTSIKNDQVHEGMLRTTDLSEDMKQTAGESMKRL